MKFLHNIDLANTAKIINIPTPVADSDLVTKGYVSQLVNSTIAGFDFQSDVKSVQVDDTLEVSSPVAGERYIITDANSLHGSFGTIVGLEDGDIIEYSGNAFVVVYDVSQRGDGVFVYTQTERQYYRYVNSVWSEAVLTAPVTVEAGDGLESVADIFSVKADGQTIEINASSEVALKDGGVTKAKLAFVPLEKVSQNVGDGTELTYTVQHNLNTKDVIVQIFENATGSTVSAESTRVDDTSVTVTFATTPSTDAYRVVVIG